MSKLPLFEDFIPVGFGSSSYSTYSLGATPNIDTGYNMSTIVGPVMEAAGCVAKEAYAYEVNDNPEHKAEAYIKEAKKHINQKINEAYESYTATNEAMVQVAGNKKPSGAQVLATVIVDYLNDNLILPSNANKKKITEEIKQLIIDSTF
jgi:hypothetical protein